jgi:hypothetical protein
MQVTRLCGCDISNSGQSKISGFGPGRINLTLTQILRRGQALGSVVFGQIKNRGKGYF